MVNDRKAAYPIGRGAVLSLKQNASFTLFYFIILQNSIQKSTANILWNCCWEIQLIAVMLLATSNLRGPS